MGVVESIPTDTLYVTIPDLVERWGSTPSKIRRMIDESYLGAVRIDGVLSIPAEFVTDEGSLPALRGSLLVLRDAGLTNDEAVAWLLTHNDELDDRPIAVLLRGSKAAVRRATQALAF